MALTWEKWRELFKGKWADVFEDAGVETDIELLSRDATAENINQKETYYTDGFKLLYTRVNPTNSQEGTIAPGRWGNIFTFARGGVGTQLFFDSYGTEMFTRSYDGAGWNGGSAATGADAWARIMTGDIRIPRNSNLNTMYTTGFYYCPTNADAATITGLPAGTPYAFGMQIARDLGTKQFLWWYGVSNYDVFVRSRSTGSYGGWKKFALSNA